MPRFAAFILMPPMPRCAADVAYAFARHAVSRHTTTHVCYCFSFICQLQESAAQLRHAFYMPLCFAAFAAARYISCGCHACWCYYASFRRYLPPVMPPTASCADTMFQRLRFFAASPRHVLIKFAAADA